MLIDWTIENVANDLSQFLITGTNVFSFRFFILEA